MDSLTVTARTASGFAAVATGTGADAVPDAIAEARDRIEADPGLVLAFVSGDYDPPDTAAQLEAGAGDATSAGLTGAGLITPDGPVGEGCVAIAFGPDVRAAAGSVRDADGDLRRSGRQAVFRALEGLGSKAEMVLLFVDSSTGDMAETIAGAYEAAGPAVRLAGGAAGGLHRCHFIDGEATCRSVVAIAIASADPIGIGLAQSCHVGENPSLVTRSEGQVVHEIDGMPAEIAYLAALGLGGVALSDDDFAAVAIARPIAQLELSADARLRHVLGRDGDGGIVVGSNIPASAAIEFVELSREQMLVSARESVAASLETLPDGAARAALIFNCAGRRKVMEGEVDRENAALREAFGEGSLPLAGLYTNGEVARIQGTTGDRNHAVVTVAFA